MNRKLIAIGLAILTLTGCQNQEELADAPESAKTYVLADLALSLPANSARTRMTTGVVQAEGSFFRGIQRLSVIPFSKQGTIIGTDMPSYYEFASAISSADWYAALSDDAKQRYRLFDRVYLTHGTASFLVYGQATAADADGGKPANGSLIANVSGQTSASVLPDRVAVAPSNITFELEPIYNSNVAPAAAQSIASILSNIANAKVVKDDGTTLTWKDGGAAGSSNSNDWLKETYKLFINQNGDKYGIIAGSKRSVTEYIKALKNRMEAADFADASDEDRLRDAILAQIVAAETGLANLSSATDIKDLPDGALALQWNLSGGIFEAKTVTSLTTPINTISRFAYPPELYYRVNSLIKTSNSEVNGTDYSEKQDWNTILTTSYKDGTVVSGNTRAVAITDPLQYAVAHLSATVKATSSSLEDADHRTIPVDNTTFPVKGIIVCGQHTVDFEFKPLTAVGEERFVYDSQIGETYMKANSPSATFHTLLLQSRDKTAGSDVGDVTIALELENKSNQNFHGEDGIIYKGTRFYLMGKITPDDGQTDATGEESTDVKKRVFTQDHTTVVNMKVSSLAHAYNVLPNILAGQLAIGVDMELDWRQTTPTVIQLTD